jgi:hypothetical protein
MPKVRKIEPINITNEKLSENEKKFIESSHDGKIEDASRLLLNKNAKRDYNAIRVPFNEYEYNELTKGAELSGRSKLNFIRLAILNQSKIEQGGNI